MKATEKDILTAKLFFTSAFPVLKVVMQENPKFFKKWKSVSAIVQFRAFNDGDDLVCHLIFDKGQLNVVQGASLDPVDIELQFSSVEKMVKMFKGSMKDLPTIKSLVKSAFKKSALTINILTLLMQLMLMMPKNQPTDDLNKYLKVKLSLYMITTALSTANKLGWDGIDTWTMQPDRIYQFVVGDMESPQIACYLRVKGGKSKAGRGIYERKTPFVCFHFFSVDGALNVLNKKKEFVDCCQDKDVEVVGSPEYGVQLNDRMAILQDMLTSF